MDVQLEFQLGCPGGRGGRRKDCPGTVAYRDSAQNALTFLFGQGLHDCRSYSGFSTLDFFANLLWRMQKWYRPDFSLKEKWNTRSTSWLNFIAPLLIKVKYIYRFGPRDVFIMGQRTLTYSSYGFPRVPAILFPKKYSKFLENSFSVVLVWLFFCLVCFSPSSSFWAATCWVSFQTSRCGRWNEWQKQWAADPVRKFLPSRFRNWGCLAAK